MGFGEKSNRFIILHGRTFFPTYGKEGTLMTLTRSTFTVCSNYNLLLEGLQHIEKCFTESNGYLKWLLIQHLILLKQSTAIQKQF